ncbi:SDR family NAD(P)-dependent oxidoreductase [Ideonella sp. A 288]|uniref:SDR family NAD(P)-dependent oxidoreductase n=1 Tax=Ideonella sp. A 288 TaxID=1962181 RepID=UPI000B4B56B3|nr:SDR family NAD(P)-dependent oxidoreductase [Ideonella sp. A 288]
MNFTLTERDSWDFARLSGDFNPLHVDPVAARRLQFGGTVCHGVHLVLKSLDLAAEAGWVVPARIETIGAVFGSPVRTGTPVDVVADREGGADRLRIVATSEGRPLFTAKLTLADGLACGPRPADRAPEAPALPLCPDFPPPQPMPALASSVPLGANTVLMQELLPSLADAPQGPELTADLLATTRIVGMVCPGLHSIYSELKLRRLRAGAISADGRMDCAVTRADPRFRSVRIDVTGCTLEGTLSAFFRAPPVSQPLLADLRSAVDAARFAGQHALVIGGSRGLGELVAKLLLTGGARVMLTYAQGQADAQRICDEAAAAGVDARATQLDASRALPPEQAAALAAAGFTHLYHFATPPISKSPAGSWSPTLFDRYCAFYVHGFVAAVRAAAAGRQGSAAPLRVLYPSTVFLDKPERGFAEYCAAKAAGEAMCDHLALDAGLAVHRPRLPRLQTDQNSSFMGVEGEPPLAVMLKVLHSLHPQDDRPRVDSAG